MIVFDIDETSLSNYAELNAADFDSNALVTAGVQSFTEQNLRSAGYDRWSGLAMKPPDRPTTLELKRGERERIEDEGFRIFVNIGDQDSDLNGGAAKPAFKLPNPMYYIPDAS